MIILLYWYLKMALFFNYIPLVEFSSEKNRCNFVLIWLKSPLHLTQWQINCFITFESGTLLLNGLLLAWGMGLGMGQWAHTPRPQSKLEPLLRADRTSANVFIIRRYTLKYLGGNEMMPATSNESANKSVSHYTILSSFWGSQPFQIKGWNCW